MATKPGFLMTGWRAAIISSSLAVIALSVWCLAQGITTVFMHLYYIPLILIAYHYRKRGLILCALLCLLYLTLVIIFDPDNPATIEGAFIRVLVFIAISVLVAYLAENLVTVRDRLVSVADIQQGIVQNANVWLMVLDKAGRILEWNRAAEEISGYAAIDVVGKNTLWKRLYPKAEYRKEITGKIAWIISQHKYLENLTTTITAKDGMEKIILWNTRELPGTPGESPRYIAIGIDITERTSAEKAVRASEAKILLLLNSAAEAIYGLDMQGNCTFCNNACLRVLGYHRQEELLGKNMHRQIHAKHADGSTFPVEECRIFQAFQNGEGTHADDEVLWRADGTSFPAEYWSYPQRYEGNVVGAVVTFMDITDRKRMEGALRTSEAKYRSLFENMLEGMAYCLMIYDDQGSPVDWVYLTVNRSFERLTGLVGVEGKRVLDVIPDIRTLTPEIFDTYGRVAKTGNPETFEIDFKPLNIWMRISAFCPEKGYFVAVFEDITERRASEDRIQALLRAQEAQVRIINTSPAVAFLWRAEENWPVEMLSENITQFGYTRDDFISGKILYSAIIHPDDIGRVGSEVEYNSSHHIDEFTQEYRIYGKDRTRYWVSDYTHIRRDTSGKITHYEGIVLDITSQKQAEENLRESEQRKAAMIAAMPDLLFILSRDGTYLDVQAADTGLLAIPVDQIIGRTIFDPDFDTTAAQVIHQAILAAIETGTLQQVEYKLVVPVGVAWFEARLVRLSDDKVLGVVRDITRIRAAEGALRESRQLFSDIISFLPDPTYVIDREGKVIAWNRALEELSGIPAGAMLGKGDFEYSIWQYGKRRPALINLVQDPDQDAARMNYLKIRREGTSVVAETQVTLQSGRRVVLSLVASPLYDGKGTITGAIESMRDITQIKETEAELARLNENLETIIHERTRSLQEEVAQRMRAENDVQAALDYTRSVIEANPDLMSVLDLEGKILDVNTVGETLTGIPTDQLIGTPYFRYLEDDGTLYTAFSRHLETGWTENVIRIRRTDGHLTPLSVHATMIKGTGTTPDRIIVSGHDITRQKSDEAAIQASLDEKVLLLREIHHRVKNNLQIIISLTNLQMRTIENPEMKQILAETRNRVRAMSLVHERLYMSENLSSIDLADYTKFLASQLFSFYGVDHLRVALQMDIEKILLDIDTAIPLGLILNELISNVLKHAFPHGGKGTLSISGHVERDMLTLTVKDDGVGMPETYNWKESDSLGLRLINSLVDQVGGTIERGTGEGTMFIITFHRKTTRGNTP